MSKRLAAAQVPLKQQDKVLLDTKNLRLPYACRKSIKLPETWKIHPVFHAALLTLYHTTKEHSPDYIRPPPVPTPESTEGEEWEVEAILSHRTKGTYKQYLVAWKGWPALENSWEPEKQSRMCRRSCATIRRGTSCSERFNALPSQIFSQLFSTISTTSPWSTLKLVSLTTASLRAQDVISLALPTSFVRDALSFTTIFLNTLSRRMRTAA